MNKKIINTRISSITPLLSPAMLMHMFPLDETLCEHVFSSRAEISKILKGEDKRLLAIVGPCSIHDPIAAMEYAVRFVKLKETLQDQLCLVMRIYFEKPRTTVGWKGFINDPDLDESFDINEGLKRARQLLLDINRLGVAVATEFVDTITPQYLADLISWAAIGARTAESQPHRMLASGLSMPVGFKNNTSGDIQAAVNAVLSARHSHRFLSVGEQGLAAIVATRGNDDCHVVLRGGTSGPNFDARSIQETASLLEKSNLPTGVMVDCSHDNSQKDFKAQIDVIEDLCEQLKQPDHHIMGFMLESHLVEGKQALKDKSDLVYGQSITDGCIGWDETVKILHHLADVLSKRGAQ